MGSFMDTLRGLLGLGIIGQESALAAFSLKETPDGRLRYLTMATNNYGDRSDEFFPASAHMEYVEWAEKEDGYPELWPFHCYGQRLGVADWMDFDGNFLISSGLIDVGMEAKAKAWADDPETRMSHGFFKRQVGSDIVQYRSFEQSVLPRWAAANPFTDFSVGAKEMALTPAKKAALAEKGYTAEEIAGLETYTDQFRQKLADAGVSFKDIDEPASDPAPPPETPVADPTPDPAAAPAAVASPSFTLDELRGVIREEIATQNKEITGAVATQAAAVADVKSAVEGFQKGADDYFATLWQKRIAATGQPPSKSDSTLVAAGKEEGSKPGSVEWVNSIPVFNHPMFGGNGQGGN